MIQNHSEHIIPTLEEYLELGRELNGSSMILDLSELLEITQFPELEGDDAQKILNLKQTAFDVIAWSMVNKLFFSTKNLTFYSRASNGLIIF